MTLSENITKSEQVTVDLYEGTKEALIAAGIVRPEQFPPEGKLGISYYSGVTRKRRGKIDENYLRVEFRHKIWRVRIGVPQEVARARTIAQDHECRARWAAQDEKREAEAQAVRDKEQAERDKAQRDFKNVPRNADGFRRSLARELRELIFESVDTRPWSWHGYTLTEEAVESIRMAVDSVTEAVMQADVSLDEERQRQIIQGYQAAILATADPALRRQMATLVKPNARILQGEAS